jgi:hypothetical protein
LASSVRSQVRTRKKVNTDRAGGRARGAARGQRVFRLDVLSCPHCGGRRRLLAFLTEPAVISSWRSARQTPSLA